MDRRRLLTTLAGIAAALPLSTRSLYGGIGTTRGGRAAREMEPFRIDFDPRLIRDLHVRIDEMRWPEMPFETGWSAGTDDAVLRDLAEYWRHGYDWFTVQGRLNRLNHLRGPIEGDQLHCVHYRAEGEAAEFPLLLIHGWPSSFHEFSIGASRLSTGAEGRSFDVVVPSLPGFALSEAPSTPGVGPDRIAERLHLLMGELGYSRYGVQGGDWGAIIGSQLARSHPEAVVGLHVNFVGTAPPPPEGAPQTPEERAYRARRERFQAAETGYSSIQGTRPQSLAYAQTDSPVGWLAWLLEKYWAWGDHGGDLWSVFERDTILTTAMLYWLPARILSAARIYHEARLQPGRPRGRVEVPTGYAHFPAEPWGPPREVVERTYNLVHYTSFDRGGHFPALEQPNLWSSDVASFFGSL